ncbi:MAG: DEAD/DEAH box helicase family protein [Spirochaetales bacterium]|nr:DEAD/DEAH box helicase family protein [Spirochaetales bacterium]
MKSNFNYLKESNISGIQETAILCEKNGLVDPRVCCMYARLTLERTLQWMYRYDAELSQPWEDTLAAMLKERSFRETTPPHIYNTCEYIRKYGNKAVHDHRNINSDSSIFIVQSLFNVLHWFYRAYFDQNITHTFDQSLIPTGEKKKTTVVKVKAIAKDVSDKHKKEIEAEKAKNNQLTEEITRLKQELAAKKKEAGALPDNFDYSEAETRKRFIDLLLSEAGWDINSDCVELEHELTGVERNKTRTGTGFADYVLFGDDGKPLAVIEAKRTSKDPEDGQQQAKDYANALEHKYGQRPVIFYTNGYSTYIWDDLRYPPESVQGFFKKEELQRIINRRENRVLNLSTIPVDENIAGGNGRTYQKLAIKAVGEHLQDGHKRALIVMATGTGKTRTIIALIKQLQQANWTKRTLFLCDRISLLGQAKDAFNNLLPTAPPVDLRADKDNTTARLCLSTYGTMMGLIDEVQNGIRTFDPGHFDLIVLDEAHRSVYQKYGAIFEYFDSILVGLTATPKKEIDKNTFDLFRVQHGVPSFNYTLEEAVLNEHLVYFDAVKVSSNLSRDGITYNELSEEEKEEYELHFSDEDTGALPEKIDKNALNQWLFNQDTVDLILETLMREGIKIEGGDKLGKTIIFAKNKDHAQFVVERFNKNYPKYAGNFCKKIDYSLGKDAETLIRQFKVDNTFQIAVSVDMLDTGIDIPSCVNLVFAKPVYSSTKFWQMIGRGTRLCPDLFGPGMDKKNFRIFDCCENFEFFKMNPEGRKGGNVEPISQKIFKRYLEIATALNKTEEPENKQLRTDALDFLHTYVCAMEEDNFIIRPKIEWVRKYNDREEWNLLTDAKVSEIYNNISPLPSTLDLDDQDAKEWDLLLLNTQISLLDSNSLKFDKQKSVIQDVGVSIIEQLSNMPEVKKLLPFIEAVSEDSYWNDITIVMVEEIRRKLRLLVRFLEKKKKEKIYSNFEDGGLEISSVDTSYFSPGELKKYKEKMEAILNQMVEDTSTTIYKIRHNIPITELDLEVLDSKLFHEAAERDAFHSIYDSNVASKWEGLVNPPLSMLIRSIVGLDKKDIEKEFSSFVTNSDYTSIEYKFVQQIIDILSKDGFIHLSALYEPPFKDLHDGGPDEVFGKEADKIFSIIKQVNNNALGCVG